MLIKHNKIKDLPAKLIAGFIAVVLSFFATSVGATIIYPNDLRWSVDRRVGGNASITAENPRSGNEFVESGLVGNASLALTTTGDLYDWAFYARSLDNTGRGLLSYINALSFDWFRKTAQDINLSGDPWNVQTPVLRLLINDRGIISELVWERYYTDSNPASMTIGAWVEQDLMNQNFWQHIFNVGYRLNTGNIQPEYDHKIPLMAIQTSSWALSDYYTDAATVYGLSVGVGSNWPYPYSGFADNIFLSFDNSNGIVISDNFELPAPVPEPSTLLLLISGMAILTAGRRWSIKLRQI